MLAKLIISFLFYFSVLSISKAQINIPFATLNNKYSGKITRQEILDNPVISIKNLNINFELTSIEYSFNSKGKLFSLLSKDTIINDEIKTFLTKELSIGNYIYIKIRIKNQEGEVIILNPLEFRLSEKLENNYPISLEYTASINQQFTIEIKKPILKHSKIEIEPITNTSRLISFDFQYFERGKIKSITCLTEEFSDKIKEIIETQTPNRRFIITNVKLRAEGKNWSLNSIEINLIK